MNRCLAVIVTATALLPGGAWSCSPGLLSPLDVMDGSARGADRFAQIVLAEVVGVRAPQRIAELQDWHGVRQEVEKHNREAKAREREQRAAWKPELGGPPLPPPETPVLLPDPPAVFELRAEVQLAVVERLLGEDGATLLDVSAGGPCGSIPRIGQQQLAFIEHNGAAHLLSLPGSDGHLRYDAEYLQRLRDCVQNGVCPASKPIRRLNTADPGSRSLR